MDCTNVEIKNIKTVSIKLLQKLFDMYVLSYSSAGQELWFKNPSDLQRYNCSVILSCSGNLDSEEFHIKAYLLYQFRTHANKISLLSHDGTNDGKRKVMELINEFLRKPGFVLEATDAVSWILRSKYRCPYFTDIEIIKKILDIKEDGNERVKLNEHFLYEDRTKQFYTHEYLKDGVVQFSNSETLFGTSLCNFEESKDGECNRVCISNNLTGGAEYKNYKIKINYN
jgi:hypothetical protein